MKRRKSQRMPAQRLLRQLGQIPPTGPKIWSVASWLEEVGAEPNFVERRLDRAARYHQNRRPPIDGNGSVGHGPSCRLLRFLAR
eukprot:1325760-Pleurochrysis_carterae.AAC.1